MICENCNIEHDGSYGSGRFCSCKCARAFATKNKRREINEKVSNSLKGRIINPDIHNVVKFCLICNKKLKYTNSSGYCLECIRYSDELKKYRSTISKNAALQIKNRKYWMPRNQTSYAEKFWITVLNNNNISYIHEYIVKIDNSHHYFLDFYIEKNEYKIDLEIDGKQHEYEDRKKHDIFRDNYLKSKGYIIYRIKWNEINSAKGKLLMKSKIDEFLDFYNNI